MPEKTEKKQLLNINLSNRPKNTQSAVFFKWAVTTGKLIIAITELVALLAFVYRFTIDGKIVDLHDAIVQEQSFVDVQKKKEADYRSIQARVKSIEEISFEATEKVTIMNMILTTISQGQFSSTNLIVNQNIVTLAGITPSIFPLNNFIEAMKKDKNVTSISLDELSSTDAGIRFKVNIELLQKNQI